MGDTVWLDPAGLRSVAGKVREVETPLTEAAPDVATASSASGSAGHDIAADALSKYASWWDPFATSLRGVASAAATTMESVADAYTATDDASADAFVRATTGPGTGAVPR
ncbi:hypothetical protein C8046_07885 [Serinibacter arcticus]|uniref:Excreted virulence factor EspC (Type VII ESX diderm) n=1 Tax=Serinibacter arcticus TaxID=1655435 RepID=A0A2U1ZUF2_9MICO|nr:hypothetical protein [Serinibacter arcticus]PWD50583.1 hypothetical protein C8046_07885 [Serinibacter arcticus]